MKWGRFVGIGWRCFEVRGRRVGGIRIAAVTRGGVVVTGFALIGRKNGGFGFGMEFRVLESVFLGRETSIDTTDDGVCSCHVC